MPLLCRPWESHGVRTLNSGPAAWPQVQVRRLRTATSAPESAPRTRRAIVDLFLPHRSPHVCLCLVPPLLFPIHAALEPHLPFCLFTQLPSMFVWLVSQAPSIPVLAWHLRPLWLQTSLLTFLSLGCLICKMRIIVDLPHRALMRVECGRVCEALRTVRGQRIVRAQ